jgi:hypothetical protein
VLARYQITGEIERVEVWLRGVSARTVKVFIAQRKLASGQCPRLPCGRLAEGACRDRDRGCQ